MSILQDSTLSSCCFQKNVWGMTEPHTFTTDTCCHLEIFPETAVNSLSSAPPHTHTHAFTRQEVPVSHTGLNHGMIKLTSLCWNPSCKCSREFFVLWVWVLWRLYFLLFWTGVGGFVEQRHLVPFSFICGWRIPFVRCWHYCSFVPIMHCSWDQESTNGE